MTDNIEDRKTYQCYECGKIDNTDNWFYTFHLDGYVISNDVPPMFVGGCDECFNSRVIHWRDSNCDKKK